MPIFEFGCRKCGNRFEEIITHAELEAGSPRCPDCNSKRTTRELSSFAISSDSTPSGNALPCGRQPGSCGGGGGGGFT